jgi:hypothetical protein
MPIVQQHALCLPVHVSDGTGGYRAEPGVGKLGDDDAMCRVVMCPKCPPTF